MQFSTLLLASLATLGLAQDLTGLPTCAITCFEDNFVNSACASTDIACLCGDTVFFGDVEICVLTTCSEADTATTLTWATAECESVGVPLKRRDVFGRKH